MQANITLEIAQNYGLTLQALAYFAKLVEEAKNWGGKPLVNSWRTALADKKHLTACKKAGLLVTQQGEWSISYRPVWALFTARGVKLAAEIGCPGIEVKA